MSTAFFGMLAGTLVLLESYLYVASILGRGALLQRIPEGEHTVPSLATWTIMSTVGGIIAFSYYERNDMDEFWFFGALAVAYCIQAVLSIWYGEHRRYGTPAFGAFDRFCLAGAGAGLVAWYFSGSWEIPITINAIVDVCGMSPTIYKVWRLPRSENFRAWTVTMVSCCFSIVALGATSTWNFDRAAFPLYLFLINGIVWVLILRRFRK